MTSLRESASAVGLPDEGLGDEGLNLDSQSAAILADAYLLADGVLRAFSAEAQAVSAATENRLWPEHFDIAIEHGAEPSGQRASYGLSPGDAEHAEPYFYVAPWNPLSDLVVWNATGFAGAELGWGRCLAAMTRTPLRWSSFASAATRSRQAEREGANGLRRPRLGYLPAR